MISTALRAILRPRDLLEAPDLVVAEAVEDALAAISDRTDLPIEDLLNRPAIAAAFGGPAYLRALLAWRATDRRWARSRRRAKGPRPAPPAVP